MWREYNEQGFLVYSFAESVAAMFPYYLVRVFAGVLYLAGGVIMGFNVLMTIYGHERQEAPVAGIPAAVPAE
jgi:cytochrome c oxidase cbb3-type subunit 1